MRDGTEHSNNFAQRWPSGVAPEDGAGGEKHFDDGGA